MRPGRPAAAASDAVRSLRLSTWGALLGAGLSLGLVVAAIRGLVPRETLGSALLVFAGLLLAALFLGLKARRLAVAEREAQSHRAMIITIAAQLGPQDDATLARIAARGGPAAEAAAMILAGRVKAPAATPPSSPSAAPRPRSTPRAGPAAPRHQPGGPP